MGLGLHPNPNLNPNPDLAEAEHAVVRAAAHEGGQRGIDAAEAALPRVVVGQARLAPPLIRAHLGRDTVLGLAGGGARRVGEDEVEGGAVAREVRRKLHAEHLTWLGLALGLELGL